MKYFVLFSHFFLIVFSSFSQNAGQFKNDVFLQKLNTDTSYTNLKKKVVKEFKHAKPGHWGEFVKGVDEGVYTKQKLIAFTFDACGKEKGKGYDYELIQLLRKENVPATLFVTGRWIDKHFKALIALSEDSLFEIENHGLNHKPCSVCGESEYGIKGTANPSEAFDEMEANARKIEAIIGKKPRFYRSATAFIDESCARMATEIGITVISYEVLSGDAVANTPDTIIAQNVIKHAKPGAIVIMHFNHPKWHTCEALRIIIPALREQGYKFIRLKDFPLKSIKD